MSVYVYKDGEKELICPTLLHSAIQSGWSVDSKPKQKARAKAKPKDTAGDGNKSTDNK